MENLSNYLEEVKKFENFEVEFSKDVMRLDDRIIVDKTNNLMIIKILNLQKETVAHILADLEDFDKLSKLPYHLNTDKNGIRSPSSTKISGSLGFLILGFTEKKDKKGKDIIYKNENRLDVRKSNISIVGKGEAIKLRNKIKEGEFRGVYDKKDKKGYRSYINVKGKQIYVGAFPRKEEAAKAYDIFSIHYFGKDTINNNTLNEEEIEEILQNGLPEKYKKKEREFPPNIYENKRGKGYYYNFSKNGRSYQRTYKTVEEAIEGKRLKLLDLENVEKDELDKDELDKEERDYDIVEEKIKKKKENFEIPEILTEEFIKNIKFARDFKELVKKQEWGGKNGYFALHKINQSLLKDCKEKAIKIIKGEIESPKTKPKIKHRELTLDEIIKNNPNKDVIRTNKNFIIEIKNNIVKIPLKNSKNKIIGQSIVSLEDYDKVSRYSFHVRVDKKSGKKTVMCGALKKPLEHVIFGNPEKGFRTTYLNNNPLDLRRDNITCLRDSEANHYKIKTKDKFSSNYKGVSTTPSKKYRSTISFNGKYIHIGTFEKEKDAARAYDVYSVHFYRNKMETNGFLSEEEIEDILKNGVPKKYAKKEEIAKDIYMNDDEEFYYEVYLYRKKYTESFSTLEEALKRKNEKITQIQELHIQKILNEEKNKEITRNEKGDAIIYLYNKKGEKVGEAIVSEEIWLEIDRYPWHLNEDGYAGGYVDGENILMHIHIFKKYINPELRETVDHINLDTLDNRLSNLREATRSLQSHNRAKSEDAIIKGLKGVTINGNRFVVNPYGKRYSFEFLEDASNKFNELAIEKFGEDARLNPWQGEGKTKVIDIIDEEDITEEFIKSIEHVELFKLIVKKKGWGGKNGKILQSYIRANTLEKYKEVAIKLLREEI